MDVTWKCPNCSQELAADDSTVGAEIECPSCGEVQLIPPASPPPKPEPAPKPAPASHEKPAAPTEKPPEPKPEHKVEHKPLAVPQHEGPAETLVKKKAETVATEVTEKRLRIRCIKRVLCEEVGHDKFEEVVSAFLQKIGEQNIVSINPVSYGFINTLGQMVNDYGVMIVYKG